MDAHGKFLDDRSEGIAACPREKEATTGFNIRRLAENFNVNGVPPLNAPIDDVTRSDYFKTFPLDSQRGLSPYIATAARNFAKASR